MWRSTLCLLCVTALGPSSGQLNLKNYKNKELLEFINHEVVKDIIPIIPSRILIANFSNNASANLGNELTPTQVRDQPDLRWPSNPKSFYTISMTDIDFPSRKEPTSREWNHWLVVNIPGKNISKGDVLAEYVGARPAKDTGLHRLVILVYKQPANLTFNEPHLNNKSPAKRDKFSIHNFVTKYNMGKPFAGNFFQAQYDEQSIMVDLQLGL